MVMNNKQCDGNVRHNCSIDWRKAGGKGQVKYITHLGTQIIGPQMRKTMHRYMKITRFLNFYLGYIIYVCAWGHTFQRDTIDRVKGQQGTKVNVMLTCFVTYVGFLSRHCPCYKTTVKDNVTRLCKLIDVSLHDSMSYFAIVKQYSVSENISY